MPNKRLELRLNKFIKMFNISIIHKNKRNAAENNEKVVHPYSRTVVLSHFWPIDHLFKKYPIDQFAVLTPLEQLVETVLYIGR